MKNIISLILVTLLLLVACGGENNTMGLEGAPKSQIKCTAAAWSCIEISNQVCPPSGRLLQTCTIIDASCADPEAVNPAMELPCTPDPIRVEVQRDIWTTDTFAHDGMGGGPGGGANDEKLLVGGWGDWHESYILFNLEDSRLPKVIEKAEIVLYELCTNDRTRVAMFLHRVLEDWNWTKTGNGRDRERLWWADRPNADQLQRVVGPGACGEFRIDVTDVYNEWMSGTFPNFGVMLSAENNNNRFNEFGSSDHADERFHPYLIVQP